MDFENQRMLEEMFNRHQKMPLIRHQFTSNPIMMEFLNTVGNVEFHLDLLAQMVLHRRANLATLIGLLERHFPELQDVADALWRAAELDIVSYNVDLEVFIMRWDVDQKTHRLINQYQYLPPMIVPPLKVTGTRGSGHITIRDDSLLLKNNHHEGDFVVSHLNRMNQIPLSINADIVRGIRNSWKHIDKPKPNEKFEEFKARQDAFEKYERDSFWIIAMLIEEGNQFYLTHKPDKRGRTYAQGYHVNTQGNTWNKACLEFYEKEMVEM